MPSLHLLSLVVNIVTKVCILEVNRYYGLKYSITIHLEFQYCYSGMCLHCSTSVECYWGVQVLKCFSQTANQEKYLSTSLLGLKTQSSDKSVFIHPAREITLHSIHTTVWLVTVSPLLSCDRFIRRSMYTRAIGFAHQIKHISYNTPSEAADCKAVEDIMFTNTQYCRRFRAAGQPVDTSWRACENMALSEAASLLIIRPTSRVSAVSFNTHYNVWKLVARTCVIWTMILFLVILSDGGGFQKVPWR